MKLRRLGYGLLVGTMALGITACKKKEHAAEMPPPAPTASHSTETVAPATPPAMEAQPAAMPQPSTMEAQPAAAPSMDATGDATQPKKQ